MKSQTISRLAQALERECSPRTLAQLHAALLDAQGDPATLAGLVAVAEDAQMTPDERQEAWAGRMMEEADAEEAQRRERLALLNGTRPDDAPTSWGDEP